MAKEIIINLTKMTLVLYEDEIIKRLPQDLLIKALKRGKYYKRAANNGIRETRIIPGNENCLTNRG